MGKFDGGGGDIFESSRGSFEPDFEVSRLCADVGTATAGCRGWSLSKTLGVSLSTTLKSLGQSFRSTAGRGGRSIPLDEGCEVVHVVGCHVAGSCGEASGGYGENIDRTRQRVEDEWQ